MRKNSVKETVTVKVYVESGVRLLDAEHLKLEKTNGFHQ